MKLKCWEVAPPFWNNGETQLAAAIFAVVCEIKKTKFIFLFLKLGNVGGGASGNQWRRDAFQLDDMAVVTWLFNDLHRSVVVGVTAVLFQCCDVRSSDHSLGCCRRSASLFRYRQRRQRRPAVGRSSPLRFYRHQLGVAVSPSLSLVDAFQVVFYWCPVCWWPSTCLRDASDARSPFWSSSSLRASVVVYLLGRRRHRSL